MSDVQPESNVVPFPNLSCACGYKLDHKRPEECVKHTVTMVCVCTPPRTLAEGERCPDCGSRVTTA